MKKAALSDDYLYIIYDALNDQITRAARQILYKEFKSKSYNFFTWVTLEDLVQVGFEGVITMKDGYPISVYVSRAKNRMRNFARDLKAEKRNEFKLLELKNYLGSTTIYDGGIDE